jgi:hypothetical protein
MAQNEKKETRRQRWTAARPTKQTLFWFCVGSVIGALIVGFAFGGWVTGGTAQKMADQSGVDAVVERLVPICVYQFNQDPQKDQKLKDLKALSSYQRREYVEKQGWATIPGEKAPDSKVADTCAKRLVEISQ